MSFILLLTWSLSLTFVATSFYGSPDINVNEPDILGFEIYNKTTYFTIEKSTNSTFNFNYYYDSEKQTFPMNSTLAHLCLSKSKKTLYVQSISDTQKRIIGWSIQKKQFVFQSEISSQITELLSLKKNENFYIVSAFTNGTISLYQEKEKQVGLIFLSNFQFDFYNENYAISMASDFKFFSVIGIVGNLTLSYYKLYIFQITENCKWKHITHVNLSISVGSSPNTNKIAMYWQNSQFHTQQQNFMTFSVSSQNGKIFRAYIKQYGSQKNWIININERAGPFNSVVGMVPSLTLKNLHFDVLGSGKLLTVNSSQADLISQNIDMHTLKLSSSQKYIMLGFSTHWQIYSFTISEQDDMLDILIAYMTGPFGQKLISSIMSVPALRQALNYFKSMFFNIDDFWLFMYHKRKYGKSIQSIFNFARSSENDKYNLFDLDKYIHYLQEFQNIVMSSYNYDGYTQEKFMKLEERSQALLSNTLQYFVLTIPFTLICFIICKVVYHMTSKFKIGQLLKRYSFIGYFFLLICQGNMQFFSYLCINQLTMLFSVNSINNIVLVFTVTFFFFVIASCVGLYFSLKIIYGKKSHVLLDCQRDNNTFLLWATFQFGIRNVILGFIHAILIDVYYYQMSAIICVDLISILYLLYIYNDDKSYFPGNWHFLMKIVNYFVRILLYLSLVFEYAMDVNQVQVNQDDEQMKLTIGLYEEVQKTLVLCLIITWILSVIIEIMPQKIVRPSVKKDILKRQNTKSKHKLFKQEIVNTKITIYKKKFTKSSRQFCKQQKPDKKQLQSIKILTDQLDKRYSKTDKSCIVNEHKLPKILLNRARNPKNLQLVNNLKAKIQQQHIQQVNFSIFKKKVQQIMY